LSYGHWAEGTAAAPHAAEISTELRPVTRRPLDETISPAKTTEGRRNSTSMRVRNRIIALSPRIPVFLADSADAADTPAQNIVPGAAMQGSRHPFTFPIKLTACRAACRV